MKWNCRYIVALLIVASLLSCHHQTLKHVAPAAQIKFTEIPSDSVLLYALRPGLSGLESVYQQREQGNWDLALQELATYLREQATHRYYFSWKDFDQKYRDYFQRYPESLRQHRSTSARMKATYSAETQWMLPFRDLQGEEVSAYRLRHLARQSNAFDMVLMYFSDPPEKENLDYWLDQMKGLNHAFQMDACEKGGNAVYELFRAGKRTHQWLLAYHCYLSSPEYTWKGQIETLRTLLHTAAQLSQAGQKNRPGNHHTRGMVGLFEIAASFPEFAQSSQWLTEATQAVAWHLETEINADGFQFERSIHYHKGDLENYLRVWQLARRNAIELPSGYQATFKKMFDALMALAQPDGRLPVLQDDTDGHHAETSDLADVMSLGTLLWQDPYYANFARGDVSPLFFWLLDAEDLSRSQTMQPRAPDFTSTSLSETGYFVMRNGWDPADAYMVISAGLSAVKPDHQHADMLGLVAYANGNEVLPNYQVKYDEPDYAFWKNSWVKNVALVDSLTQSRQWQGNSGGSGFGKWLDLPQPGVATVWFDDDLDYFAGGHNGFDSLGLSYEREVIFIKQGFWIVSDHFSNASSRLHEYQQVWQGLFQDRDENSVRRTFENGNTLVIQRLEDQLPVVWRHGRFGGKGNVLRVESSAARDHYLSTLISTASQGGSVLPGGWQVAEDLQAIPSWSSLQLGGAEWAVYSPQMLLTRVHALAMGATAIQFSQATQLLISRVGVEHQLRVLSPGTLEYSLQKQDQVLEDRTAIRSGAIIIF